jgi:hypothetical protein
LVLFSIFVVYGVSGYVMWLWNMKSGKNAADVLKKPVPAEEPPAP